MIGSGMRAHVLVCCLVAACSAPPGTDDAGAGGGSAGGAFDLSDYFATIAEVYYTYNRNRTTFKDSISGIAEPSFEKPNAVGFNATLQARF